MFLVCLSLLFLHAAGGEWVEIPHLKPSSSVGASINTGASSISSSLNSEGHQLLSHLADGGTRWSPGTAVRWHRPVSDLLDLDRPGHDGIIRRVSRPTVPVRVFGKVEPWHPHIEEQKEEDGEEEEEDQEPETELLPFGNRYQEESIETLPVGPPKGRQPAQHGVPPRTEKTPLYTPEDDEDDATVEDEAEDEPEPEHDDDGDDDDDDYDQDGDDEPSKEMHRQQPKKPATGTSVGPLGGFLEFLRRMQASFVQRTGHTLGDKIRNLVGMRDQLLTAIERRIAALWTTVPRRVRRGWMEAHSGTDAMDFPSAEGALLTISFLTFAVFLIKLVLQVINTIKAKHYTYSTFTAATPVSGGVLVKRTRREIDRDLRELLQALDGYRPT